jgi:hypothetical protein
MNVILVMSKIMGRLLTVAFAVGVPTQAFAFTIEMYSGGSSSATPYAAEVPLNLCDPGANFADPNIPRLYINGPLHPNAVVTGQSGIITPGKILIWVCQRTVGGTTFDVVMAYSATGSGDGIRKVAQDIMQNASKMNFFNHNNPNCAINNIQKTRPSDNKIYLENWFCDGDGVVQTIGGESAKHAVAKGINVGWSDAEAAAFHQCGPGIGAANCTAGLPVPAQTDEVAITPFTLVLGNGVIRPDPTNPTQSAGRVSNLSLHQINSIFSDRVSDWRQLGLGVVRPCFFNVNYWTTSPGVVDAVDGRATCVGKSVGDTPAAGEPLLTTTEPNRVITAHRRHGSGAKAAFDETVMIIAEETTTGLPLQLSTAAMNTFNPPSGNIFGTSNQDIRDIVGGNYTTGINRWAHPNAIGYMEQGQAYLLTTFPPLKHPADPRVFAPGGYIVRFDGFLAYDQSYSPAALPNPLSDPSGWQAAVNKRKNDLHCGRYPFWTIQRFNRRAGSATDQLNNPSTDLENLVLDYLASAQNPATIGILPAGEFWTSPSFMNVSKIDTKDPLQWKVQPVPQACIYNSKQMNSPVLDSDNAY